MLCLFYISHLLCLLNLLSASFFLIFPFFSPSTFHFFLFFSSIIFSASAFCFLSLFLYYILYLLEYLGWPLYIRHSQHISPPQLPTTEEHRPLIKTQNGGNYQTIRKVRLGRKRANLQNHHRILHSAQLRERENPSFSLHLPLTSPQLSSWTCTQTRPELGFPRHPARFLLS